MKETTLEIKENNSHKLEVISRFTDALMIEYGTDDSSDYSRLFNLADEIADIIISNPADTDDQIFEKIIASSTFQQAKYNLHVQDDYIDGHLQNLRGQLKSTK